MKLGDMTYDDLLAQSKPRESLLYSAKNMQVDRKFMLAMCEDEGHHRTGQGGFGFATCYCGDSLVLFVKT